MKKQFITSLFIIACLTFSGFCEIDMAWAKNITTQETDTIARLVSEGEISYQNGDMGHAVKLWEQAISLMNPLIDSSQRLEPTRMSIYLKTLIHLTDACKVIGHHHKALTHLHNALPIVEKSKDLYQNALFYGSLGELYLSLGNMKDARLFLEKGKNIAEESEHPYTMASLFNSLGNLLTSDEKYSEAIQSYEQGDLALRKMQGVQGFLEPALRDLKTTLLINKTRLLCQIQSELICSGQRSEPTDSQDSDLDQQRIKAIENARIHIENMPDSHGKAKNLISLGLIVSQMGSSQRLEPTAGMRLEPTAGMRLEPTAGMRLEPTAGMRLEPTAGMRLEPTAGMRLEPTAGIGFSTSATAYKLFTKAEKIAEDLHDDRTRSYALGYTGQLYESEKRYSEAKKLTRQAIFFAGNLPRIRYLWEWQLGRLCKADGNIENATKAYQLAIQTLTPIRWEVMNDYRSRKNPFYDKIRPVYLGLAELLLKQAEMLLDENAKEEKLKAAIDTMELVKTSELQNFFHDECVTAMDKEMIRLVRSPSHTAILYPILLPDSLSLLLILPDKMKHISIPIKSELLTNSVRTFQMQVQSRRSYTYKTYAIQLYDWLIRPLEPELAAKNTDTLIVAPDSVFRLIPFAALYDGTQYLVEKYAVVTVPAVTLTDMTPLGIQRLDLLAGGLSQARHGFSPLPNVPTELESIKKAIGGKTLLNKDYTTANLTGEFREQAYPVVHMATHGVFGGSAKESFLLAYDDRLTMDRLEQLIGLARFREHPVELLTLSACQTALGDERAALGLAGVALKAGARSALATLWSVDDESTYLAVSEFYRQLKTPGMTKAKALQNAQKKLISERQFQHPVYWAPFLLIGNWM